MSKIIKTLELGIIRRFLGEKYTIGTFLIEDLRLCDTLEDKSRDLNNDGDLSDPGETKVKGETCIPVGRYRVKMAYSPHFKRRLPLLIGVKTHSGILIHRGNTPADTLGCILPGENKIKGQVINSTYYEVKICKAVEAAEKEGKEVWITIK